MNHEATDWQKFLPSIQTMLRLQDWNAEFTACLCTEASTEQGPSAQGYRWIWITAELVTVLELRLQHAPSQSLVAPFWLAHGHSSLNWPARIRYLTVYAASPLSEVLPTASLRALSPEDLSGTPWREGKSATLYLGTGANAAQVSSPAAPAAAGPAVVGLPREKFMSRYRVADPGVRSGGRRVRSADCGPRPKFTIVTIVRNADSLIEQTLQSVLNQTSQDYEYIVVDGLSTDATLEIVSRYDQWLEYWVSEQDDGIYDAMNKGIILARGEFVITLNAGDFFYSPHVLSEAAVFGEACDAIYGITRYSDGRDMFPCVQRPWYRFAAVGHPAAILALATYKQVGLYYPSLKVNADAEMMFRVERDRRRFRIKEVPLSVTYYRAGGFSDQNVPTARLNEFAIRLIYGDPTGRTIVLYLLKAARSQLSAWLKFDIFNLLKQLKPRAAEKLR